MHFSRSLSFVVYMTCYLLEYSLKDYRMNKTQNISIYVFIYRYVKFCSLFLGI